MQTTRWVFGYGSLMWRPGFPYKCTVPAIMYGVHRALCVYSYVHRGTRQCPGLVLGLDTGGACVGLGFEIEAADWNAVVDYLREREQVTSVYVECARTMTLRCAPPRKVRALTFLADSDHAQYAGKLSLEDQLRYVRQGNGRGGANTEYVLNTARHLRQMRIRDETLMQLAARLQADGPDAWAQESPPYRPVAGATGAPHG